MLSVPPKTISEKRHLIFIVLKIIYYRAAKENYLRQVLHTLYQNDITVVSHDVVV